MLVAAGAMFFAVASSAFLLRARSHDCTRGARRQAVRPAGPTEHAPRPRAERPAPQPAAAPGCGRAIYEGNADGSVSVVFGLCPDAAEGVAVDRVVSDAD